MKIINVIGSPGLGKSTLAYRLAGKMKASGYNVEYVNEFAKDRVYEQNSIALDCQPYIFGNQLYKTEILEKKVDYVIVDSSILLSVIYNKKWPESFNRSVIDIYKQLNCVTLYLDGQRNYQYDDRGRIHSESESDKINRQIEELLIKENIEYTTIDQYSIKYEELLKIIGIEV